MHALIYTRSYRVDYQYFAGPQELRDDKEVDSHIRNVMDEESQGELVGVKRWHVFRKDKWLIIGMATEDYGRRDNANEPNPGRLIRGYYGFAMSVEDAKIPSLRLFDEIENRFVVSVFYQASVTPSDGVVQGGIFDDESQYVQPMDFGHWTFNTDPGKVRFHVSDDIDTLVRSAVAHATKVNKFEIVIGLNTVAHALELPICNCLCRDVVSGHDRKLGAEAEIKKEVPRQRREIDCQISKGAADGIHRESILDDGVKTRKLREREEVGGGIPLFGGRRGQNPSLHVDGGMRKARRVVIDLENENEHDNGFWRELLSAVNRILMLCGIRARCKIEETNASSQKSASVGGKPMTGRLMTDKKIARNYLESGF